MEILVKRFARTDSSTLAEIFVNGVKRAYIVEDADRGLTADMPLVEIKRIKVWGQTAIPTGRYRVTMRYSPKFKRYLPWLKDVPGFEYIYIHPGNWIRETEGCLLPGQSYMLENGAYSTRSSIKAFEPIDAAINAALARKEPVYCTVSRTYNLAA